MVGCVWASLGSCWWVGSGGAGPWPRTHRNVEWPVSRGVVVWGTAEEAGQVGWLLASLVGEVVGLGGC